MDIRCFFHFQNISRVPDWTLSRANFGPGPYVWHLRSSGIFEVKICRSLSDSHTGPTCTDLTIFHYAIFHCVSDEHSLTLTICLSPPLSPIHCHVKVLIWLNDWISCLDIKPQLTLGRSIQPRIAFGPFSSLRSPCVFWVTDVALGTSRGTLYSIKAQQSAANVSL